MFLGELLMQLVTNVALVICPFVVTVAQMDREVVRVMEWPGLVSA
jgi:hypothetical protein